MPNPAVQLRLARAADAEAVADFLQATFADDPLHHSTFHTPGPGVASDIDEAEIARQEHALRVARTRKGVWQHHHQETADRPAYTLVAVLDGAVVGIARWMGPRNSPIVQPDTPLDIAEPPDTTPPPCCNAKVAASHEQLLDARRLELLGDAQAAEYWYLGALGVAPQAQGKGVGGALVAWGTERADEQKRKCYVESSDAGLGVYRKGGFVDEGAWIDFPYGGRRQPMVRSVKNGDGA